MSEFKIAFGLTSRGFGRGEFLDRYAAECSVQDSSLATENCIWLGVDRTNNGEESHRMHLTQEMAAALIPVLQRFVDTGTVTA